MSASSCGGDGRNVPLQVDNCKFDDDLVVTPDPSSWKLGVSKECGDPISTFPYLSAFLNSACIAYTDHNGAPLTQSNEAIDRESTLKRCLKIFNIFDVFKKSGDKMNSAEEELEDYNQMVSQLTQVGFEFLAEAKNKSNGYRGVVYVNWKKKQLIVSHRGTEISRLGSLWADVKTVWGGAYSSHLSSAITFAHHVAQYAQKNNYQFFFTGHSLGAWLAQITCFSTKYLTTNESGHFVRKPQGEWDSMHPYTVAFDSPGALEFLLKMKKDFLLMNEPQSQMGVNVACLPVEVVQFHPNSVNGINTQIGSVYLVDIDKAKVTHSFLRVNTEFLGMELKMRKSVVLETHWKDPVRKLVASNGTVSEENVLTHQVLDYRVPKKWDDTFLEQWEVEGRSVDVNLSRFPEYFLTSRDLEVLRKQKGKDVHGCYEGLSYEDERIANKIVEYSRREGGVFAEGCVQLGEELDRLEAIPLVRHFVETLRTKNIWWNPRKPRMPKNYVERRVAGTADFQFNGTLHSEVPRRTLTEELKSDKLVLLVDAPGMGKSSEMTHLEHKLRMEANSKRIILRVNLNEVQTALKNVSSDDNVNSVLLKLAHPFLPPESLQTPPLSLFVLLDGLDEVCPKHAHTMITLLKILTSTEEDPQRRNIRVVVTSRPHLREAVESKFNLKSVSLLPLTEEEQTSYIMKVLGVSTEQLSEIRDKLTNSVKELLSNPLMLNMFVDIIKSGGTFSGGGGGAVNIFELYRRFVESKHKLHLVEKEKMGAEDNYTEMRLEGMLERNLPQYYRAAVNMLIEESKDEGSEDEESEDEESEDEESEDEESEGNFTEDLIKECRGGSVVAQDEPFGVTRIELLSVGLLLEDGDNRLVFKHRSFGEFFYARLLTQEESLPQLARDVLFGNIFTRYNVYENVEAFIAAAAATAQVASSPSLTLSSASTAKRPKLTSSGGCGPTAQVPSSLLFTLSPKWILLKKDFESRCWTLKKLVNGSKLFPLLAREVLLSFVSGDSSDDLLEVLKVLLDESSKSAFTAFIRWMRKNGEWTKRELFNCGEQQRAIAHLFALTLEEEELLTEDEVGVALSSLENRLIYYVTSILTEGGSKWEWVESHLPGGRSQLRNLFLQMDNEDLTVVLEDVETTCKLVQILTWEEIGALVANEETRVGDVIGEWPQGVVVALGEEFLPPKQLAEFRTKLREEEEEEGKTVFEMDGCDFAVEYLWGELVGEVERGDRSGPVGVALREALGRMDGWKSCKLLRKLEEMEEVQRGRRRSQHGSGRRSGAAEAEEVGGVTMEWVTGGGLQWRDISDTTLSRKSLPLLLRYYGNATPSHLTTFLQEVKSYLSYSSHLMGLLRSVVILSSPPSSSLDSSPSLFSTLTSFLRENINEMPKKCRPLVELFLGVTREEIQAAAAAASSPPYLVREVCVGGVALKLLLTTTQQPTQILEKETWVVLLCDVIKTARCCDLPHLLHQLRQQMGEQQTQMRDNHLGEGLRLKEEELLTSYKVISQWTERFGAWNRRQGEECDWCGLRHFLTFYFSVFGADNLEWMKYDDDWDLVRFIPVEIATALQGEEMKEKYPSNSKLLQMFTEMVGGFIGFGLQGDVTFVNEIRDSFWYKTEWEWETLVDLIGGEGALQRGIFYPGRVFPTSTAAPLIRVLRRKFGVEWTRNWLSKHLLWKQIPSTVEYFGDTVESLGSLLHSAIQLGELDEVKKRAWPGIYFWRNKRGKTALEVAKETATKDVEGKIQMIVQYLEGLISLIQR